MERPSFDVGAVVAVGAYVLVSALSAALSFDDEYLPIVFGAVAPVIYSPAVAVVCAPIVPRLYRKLGRTRTLALCAFFFCLLARLSAHFTVGWSSCRALFLRTLELWCD